MSRPKKPAHGWTTPAAVAIGGVIGAAVRWMSTQTLTEGALPWGTLTVNLAGAFLLGLVIERLGAPGELTEGRRRALVGIASGFCGSLTTFSTLAVESAELLTGGDRAVALLYLVITVAGGVTALLMGRSLSQRIRH